MLNLDFIYCAAISYAMAQNNVPVVRRLTLDNSSDEPIEDIKVIISFVDSPFEDFTTDVVVVPANSSLSVPNVILPLSAKYMAKLTERVRDEIEVKVTSSKGEEIFSQRYPVEVLPFDQWAGANVLPELIAAFVTPNHPIIAPIIHRASEILGNWTGTPSFDQYFTKNPDRVKKQMAAIYEAITELQIVYCVPPASFEYAGQRVRMSDTILSQKLGTCFDMTLLYATCLEAVGINPILIMIKEHAFAGGWLVDETFADAVNDDISLLTKRLADGINELVVVECTCMNAGMNFTFDHATASAEDKLIKDKDFEYVVDIQRCRFASILPLPQRIIDAEGVHIIETAPKERSSNSPEVVEQDKRHIDFTQTETSKQRVWERKLLDLSLRNNLLNIRLTKSTLQLMSININLLEDSLAAGDEFGILPKPQDWANGVMDSGIFQSIHKNDPINNLIAQELTQKRLRSHLSERDLASSLTNLYRSSRSSMEENGANTLYLALGLMKWYETNQSQRPRYAPILLLPVEIIRKSAAKGYVIRSREEEVMMNITLLEMLRQDFEINIGGLEVLPKDESGVDVKLVFNTIRKGIMNQKRWDVEEQAILGIFSFNKFIMWNDIHNNAQKLCENKIVKSLISGVVQWEGKEEVEVNLDKEFSPSDIALPISADSCQMEAVCSADAGDSFILHGPPGTGKSQTITNIIANALYKGQKVLFVAEKMAALSVVQKRLADIGLAPFCLELHSNKAKKSAVLEQIRITTEIAKKLPSEEFALESERLHTLRSELGEYVELLHKENSIGESLYSAICGYTQNDSAGGDYKIDETIISQLSKSRLVAWRDTLEQMQSIVNLCGSIISHPLRDVKLSLYSTSAKESIKEDLLRNIELLNGFDNCSNALLSSIFDGKITCKSFAEYNTLIELLNVISKSRYVSPALLSQQNIKEVVSSTDVVIKRGKKRDEMKSKLLSIFSKLVLDVNADELLLQWRQAENSWFLPKFFGQYKITKLLKRYSITGKLTKVDIQPTLTDLIEYHEEDNYISSKNNEYASIFGSKWQQWSIMQECCDSCVDITNRIMSMSGDIAIGLDVCSTLAEKYRNGEDTFLSLYGRNIEKSTSLFKDVNSASEKLQQQYAIEPTSQDNWIDSSTEQAERISGNIDKLRDWCNWNSICIKALNDGLASLVEYVSASDNRNIIALFDKALYKYIINSTIDSEPALANFNGKLFEDKIRKFKELTLSFEALTQQELYAKLSANIPSFTKEASQSSEVGILQRNIRNKGRGVSIRKLFDTIPTLISRVAPCMLMSPMSVAQYLDANNMHFDLVIFDEASQMPTCEAVGAIARGNNLIVVGDPKQMPPTSFFSSNSVDENNLDKEDLESILDDCLALSISSKHLLWHYRSKHESLIAFSNSQYYENKLLTFPSPDDIKSKVTIQPIEGFYDKGKSRQNRAEAEAIVSEVITRLNDKDSPQRSIGIVTFSSTQQNLIEDLLTEAFVADHALEEKALNCSEPLFVKNLENVQGDERDIILFSVGYGPNKEGKVSLNFGPLNRDGGWRRLNVAVSRARYEMKVFSTLRSDQIDLSRTASEGVAGLKAFLEYAEKGKNSFSSSLSATLTKSDNLISLIAQKLEERGYDVNTNIGCSGYRVDIGVVDPENKSEYVLGIVCDGENYKSAKCSRDREIIQTDVLRLLGWSVHRIWSMDWVESPDMVIDGIVEAIKVAASKETVKEVCTPKIVAQPPVAPEQQPSEHIEEVVVESEQSKYQIEYNHHPIVPCGIFSEEFISGKWNDIICQQVSDVIYTEAPISREQLCRRVLSMWGISRIASRIDAHFTALFKRMAIKQTGDGKDLFFWREDQTPTEYMNYRVGYSVASDIAPEEISVAVKEILEEQISLSREDLVREVAHIFGYTRLGTIVLPSMERGIDKAIERNFAKEDGDRVILS